MIKKLVVCFIILVCVFLGYKWLYPSLEDQLFIAIKEKCSNQKNCMIHLHEITPFKWDKTYFFPSGNNYSNQEIKKATGITFYFQRNNDLAIFMYNNRLVKYAFFTLPEDEDEASRPLFIKNTNLVIAFESTKTILSIKNYTQNIKNFKDYIPYYELTPDNDLLYAGYIPNNYSKFDVAQSWLSFSNINQIHLSNPK